MSASRQRETTALSARLADLEVSAAELSAVIRRPVEDIESWIDGSSEADPEAVVLLRIVFDPARQYALELAVDRVRKMRVLPLRAGTDAARLGIAPPPYGGGREGTTGGSPS